MVEHRAPDRERAGAQHHPHGALDKQGVDYTTIDVTEDAASLDYIKGLGYQQAPVVIAGEDHWSGFRPDRIKAAAALAAPLALQA